MGLKKYKLIGNIRTIALWNLLDYIAQQYYYYLDVANSFSN